MSSTTKRSIPIKLRGTQETIELTDVSQSVGGTIYGTTPGGTKRLYKRHELLSYRNSPFSSTPPVNLPVIPGVTKQHAEDESPQVQDTLPVDNDFDDDEVHREPTSDVHDGHEGMPFKTNLAINTRTHTLSSPFYIHTDIFDME